jgi:methylated-DNA-[protein]-cysteine S-methyltransferase
MEVPVLGERLTLEEAYLEAEPARVEAQIREYLDGTRRSFSIEVSPPETFTGQVMAAMSRIPFGETRRYGDIAAELDTAAVAVGQAAGRNPVPIIVPCHRVVAADGLGGYSAPGGPSLKERLLRHEGALD